MTAPAVSVIVVSRHRPAELQRCVTGLRQQDHAALELIVVADPAALAQLSGADIKRVAFDEPNISAARNAGIARAAGDVVAFIDDDAVPEPTWAGRLASPFADARVMQAGGFVRARNGFSFQWQAMGVDAAGRDHPLAVPPGVSLHRGSSARAVKTQGTNCAFRREALLAAGGFDTAFRFYLDEADLNLRLAARGGLTAVVPGAEVHHGFAASVRRRADRAPLDLHEIGASTAVFLNRHAPEAKAREIVALREAQRQRLLRLMVDGRLEPRDVPRLMATLDAGIADGNGRESAQYQPVAGEQDFRALAGCGPRPGRVIAGRIWQAPRLAEMAAEGVRDGAIVTAICLAPSPRRHWMQFDPAGYWWQIGGLFGPSDRSEPAFRGWRFGDRVAQETARHAARRPVGPA